jgi:16S rRNA (cytidine1402-2'-O)-methyltransferase
LVSDAGTPGIADPGNKLVEEIVEKLGHKVEIIPIPGPSAVTSIASICGFPMDRFLFLGYPPAKRKRNKFFEEVIASKHPVILYESPHRILKTLTELSLINNNLSIVVSRELTKKFETTYRGTPQQVIQQLESDTIKGEFVVVVNRN